MPEFQINYLAVGVAALVTFFIGALWYSPLLFGKLWLKAHGYSEEQMRKTAGRAYIVSLFCYVVMAFVLAVLVSYTGVSTVPQGAFLGLLVWIGFLATLGADCSYVLRETVVDLPHRCWLSASLRRGNGSHTRSVAVRAESPTPASL